MRSIFMKVLLALSVGFVTAGPAGRYVGDGAGACGGHNGISARWVVYRSHCGA